MPLSEHPEQKVWVIKLFKTRSYGWYGNPTISEIILPDKEDSKVEECHYGLKVPQYGFIYWWEIKEAEVWLRGIKIETKVFPNPNPGVLLCDL